MGTGSIWNPEAVQGSTRTLGRFTSAIMKTLYSRWVRLIIRSLIQDFELELHEVQGEEAAEVQTAGIDLRFNLLLRVEKPEPLTPADSGLASPS